MKKITVLKKDANVEVIVVMVFTRATGLLAPSLTPTAVSHAGQCTL